MGLDGKQYYLQLGDLGMSSTYGADVLLDTKRGALDSPARAVPQRSTKRAKSLLMQHVPESMAGQPSSAEVTAQQGDEARKLARQVPHAAMMVPSKSEHSDGAPLLVEISRRALHLLTGCFPSEARDHYNKLWAGELKHTHHQSCIL
jgi:hypothetical protein